MHVARVLLLLLAASSFATAAAGDDDTHGQLRGTATAAAVAPLPMLIEGLASIGNAYQLKKLAEAVQEALKAATAAPIPTPASTFLGHTPTPTVVVKPPSCRPKAKASVASDAAVLARLTAIEAVLEDIQQLLETRRP